MGGSVPGSQGCLPGGGCLPLDRGVYTSSLDRKLDSSCENITFSQLRLWTVISESDLRWFWI